MRKERHKTIVNIGEINDCCPQLKIAKIAFLDFQSSALPTELSCQPLITNEIRRLKPYSLDHAPLFVPL
jgi:hypothetical protein